MTVQIAAHPGLQHESESAKSISRTVAEFAENLTYEDLPAGLVEFAKHHILDVVGISLTATRFDFAHRALTGLSGLGVDAQSTIVGMLPKLALKDAILMNGILAHGLDYDDTHPGGPVHPSASAFPCAFVLSEFLDRSGKDLVTAYILGVEVTTRIGIAANGAIHKSGFHTTGVAGHFGCAVAAGRLFNLNAEQLMWAQGLAGSTASAIAQYRADGSSSKRMNTGWAGVGGATAASLARTGFSGPKEVYEGVDGLFRSHTGPYHSEVNIGAMTERLGNVWRTEEVAVKPYPICHILHACVDSVLALKRQYNFKSQDVVEVRALMSPETFHQVCDWPELRRKPASDYIAKFSVYYTLAASLIRGKFGFAELEPDVLNNPEILALAQRVTYGEDPQSQFPRYFSGGVKITLKSGQTLTHFEKVNRGAGDRALTGEEIAEKFMDNAELVVSRNRAEEIRDLVLSIERYNGRHIAQILAGRPGAL